MSNEELNKSDKNVMKLSDVMPAAGANHKDEKPVVVEKPVEGATAEKVVEKPVVLPDFEVIEEPSKKPEISFKDRLKLASTKLSSFKTFAKDKATKIFKKKDAAEQQPSTRKFKLSARTIGITVVGMFVVLIATAIIMPTAANETSKTAHWATTTSIGTSIYHDRLDCPYLKAATNVGANMVEAKNAPDARGRISFTIDGVSYNAAPCVCVAK
jgi:hypothetical protein